MKYTYSKQHMMTRGKLRKKKINGGRKRGSRMGQRYIEEIDRETQRGRTNRQTMSQTDRQTINQISN